MRVSVGVTGASGAIYGYSLILVLAEMGIDVHVIYTKMGEKVLEYECGVTLDNIKKYAKVYCNNDLFTPLASGSFYIDSMVVVPCSMHTLGTIASGSGSDLLTRAVDVTLKERRKLVLVPREAPITAIHLENMLKLSKNGAIILPASPAFYHKPLTINDIVGFMVGKIMDALGIKHQLYRRWGE